MTEWEASFVSLIDRANEPVIPDKRSAAKCRSGTPLQRSAPNAAEVPALRFAALHFGGDDRPSGYRWAVFLIFLTPRSSQIVT
jgi:hypothetical protein